MPVDLSWAIEHLTQALTTVELSYNLQSSLSIIDW